MVAPVKWRHHFSRVRLRFVKEGRTRFHLECEREEDGRWLAEVSELPGVLAYAASANETVAKAEALAFRVLAEPLEHGKALPLDINVSLLRNDPF